MGPEGMRVAIVGAGIAGLTAAIALREIGADCHVYERATHLREIGAGIQLSPNGTRILHRLGLAEPLARVATRPRAVEVRRWDDDSLIGRTPLGEPCEELYGAPYYVLRRADLHQTLLERLPQGIVHLGLKCTRVDVDRERPRVDFANGHTVEADLVLAADGIRSSVRSQLLGDEPRFSGISVYRGVVPSHLVDHDPEGPRVLIRTGPGRHAVAYPVDNGRLVSFVATTPDRGEWREESWTAEGDPVDLLSHYEGWAPPLRALFEAAESVTRWALYDRPSVQGWTTPNLALVGDAAHPMLPFGAQGASQAVEDVAALAACLDQVSPDDLPKALQRYETVRRERTRTVQSFVQKNERDHHADDGREQIDRDRRALDEWSLEGRGWLFGYHAEKEAVE
ncbi:FAD-dependent monooxygenase [Glycomyces sp. TRM65418]|uniref:FAD-dependent monooxygenase n=1 Tax=Glycomyces sp. TRM65418 TaxID=2867006 RepID=UPI001CE60750|nr:FAD-dependent monooxygenase [Glycomyces sp. TRM65418]MCC3761597.1 FAD-dependent monooxygenase [Glycomyces sp. TRM65418]QZD55693.1 FAD-dependent monooxygenase [Glycomyces sp. TRM65418]